MKKKEFPSRTGTETKSLPFQDGDSWILDKIQNHIRRGIQSKKRVAWVEERGCC